jgi:hypothetical protein
MDYRYNDRQRAFDESLSKELNQIELDKQSSDEVPEESGIRRIAQKKTPLDQVKEVIEASQRKSAAEEIREFGVRRKLAALKNNRNG